MLQQPKYVHFYVKHKMMQFNFKFTIMLYSDFKYTNKTFQYF